MLISHPLRQILGDKTGNDRRLVAQRYGPRLWPGPTHCNSDQHDHAAEQLERQDWLPYQEPAATTVRKGCR